MGLLTAGLLMGAGAWGKPQRTPAVPVGFAEPMITMHQAVAEAWARLPQRNSLAAQAERVAIEAQAAMAHLVLAADVLRLATSATDAANTRAIAARRLATSRALAGDLSRQFAVGEAAQSDALAAEADGECGRDPGAGGVAAGRGQGDAGGGDGVAGDPCIGRASGDHAGGDGCVAGGRASAAPRGDGAGAGGAGAAAAGVSAGS